MKVRVKLFAGFREAAGGSKELMDDVGTVGEVLDELVRRFGKKMEEKIYRPEMRELREIAIVLLNGRSLDIPHELSLPLKESDVIAIFPPVSGG